MTAETEAKKESGNNTRWRVVLTSWAAVATALFLFTLIFGAVYVVNVKPECDDNGEETSSETSPATTVNVNIKNGEDKETETIYENKDKHTDFIMKKNKDGHVELIVGVDYNKKSSCVYLAVEDVCVLSTGEDLDWYDDAEDDKNTTVEFKEDDATPYKYTLENKVTDVTQLTSEMQMICTGKDIFWAKEEETGVAVREERALLCWRCYWYWARCLRWSGWRWYWGWCLRYRCYWRLCG